MFSDLLQMSRASSSVSICFISSLQTAQYFCLTRWSHCELSQKQVIISCCALAETAQTTSWSLASHSLAFLKTHDVMMKKTKYWKQEGQQIKFGKRKKREK